MRSNNVGLRALRVSLLISSIFLLISASIFYAYESRQTKARIEAEVRLLFEAQSSGIAESLWDYDNELLKALIDGLRFYPYINYVEIEDAYGSVIESGARKPGSIEESFTLRKKTTGGVEAELGTLRLEIDSARISEDINGQVLSAIAVQLLFLVMESLIVLILFSRMVTRHLTKIAEYIAAFKSGPDAPPLNLDKTDRGDELDLLVRSFNAMRDNLDGSREAELRAMEELRLSEERNRILVEEAPDAILMFDVEQQRFTTCNRRALDLFGLSLEEMLRVRAEELYLPEQPDGLPIAESVARIDSLALAGKPQLIRRNVSTPRGLIVCEVRISALPSLGHKTLRVSYLDISDRVRAEEEVVRSLREKEVLLQEIYHRTKNNMQLIAAFMSMEAAAAGDDRVSAILEKMTGRIAAMALVHRKLYESNDLSRIDLGEYLGDLVREIRQALLGDRPELRITLEAEGGIVALLDTALPCGLVVNELIVNAIKYAFPKGRSGTISVELARESPGELRLGVIDDGVGLPLGFDLKRDGKIGLQTVISLIESQLRGRLETEAGPGLRLKAYIKDNVYSARI